MPEHQVLEFWPEYGRGGPLWHPDGTPADLDRLGMADPLRERLIAWNAQYADEKLPVGGHGNDRWQAEGRGLLNAVRAALDGRYEVIVHEDWWGEPGIEFRQPE